MAYVVIKELKAPTKMSKHFFLFDICFIVVFFGVSFLFRELVYGSLQPVYFIFNIYISIRLVSRSKTNPGKHFYQALFIWTKREGNFFWEELNYSKDQLLRRMNRALKESK